MLEYGAFVSSVHTISEELRVKAKLQVIGQLHGVPGIVSAAVGTGLVRLLE
jgi:hypothetical protein